MYLRLISILLFLSWQNKASAQSLRFQQQKAHACNVKDMVFTPDNKTLLTGDECGEIIEWSVPDGNIIRNITDRQMYINSLCLSPDGKILLAAGGNAANHRTEITAWKWPEAEKLFAITESYVTRVIFKPDGSGFYGFGMDYRSFNLQLLCAEFNAKGKKLKEFAVVGDFQIMDLLRPSPDGNRIAMMISYGREKKVAVFDMKNETCTGLLENKFGSNIEVQNNGDWVVGYVKMNEVMSVKYNEQDKKSIESPSTSFKHFMMSDENEGNSGKRYSVFSPFTKKVSTLTIPDIYDDLDPKVWATTSDGKFMAIILDDKKYYNQTISFWNPSTEKMFWSSACVFSPVYSLDSYYDSKIIMGKNGPLEVWDPARHDVYLEFPGGTEVCHKVTTNKKDYTVYTHQWRPTLGYFGSLVDPGKKSVEKIMAGEISQLALSEDFSAGAYVSAGVGQGRIYFFDPRTLRETGSFKTASSVGTIAMSPDGSLCVSIINIRDSTALVDIIDVFSKKIRSSFTLSFVKARRYNISRIGMAFSDDGKFLVINTSSHTHIYDLRLNALVKVFKYPSFGDSFNPIVIHPSSKKMAIAAKSAELHLVDMSGKLISVLPGGNGNISAMTFLDGGRILASSYMDGSVRLFDVEKNIQLVTFLGVENGDYLLYTPDGYYMGAGKGLDLVGFYEGKKYISRQTLDKKFNCPDIVMTRIGIAGKKLIKTYETAREKRMQRSSYDTTTTSVQVRPKVEISGKYDLPFIAGSSKLSLKFAIRDSLKELSSFKIYQNGVPVLSEPLKGKTITISRTLDLIQGKNKIEIVAINSTGIESAYEVFHTYWKEPNNTLPELYILAVGVSKFSETERNLDFAAKDAKEIVEAFGKSPAFSKVNKVLLTDKDATLSNFEKQLAFLQKAKPGDVIVVYFSTHGLLDDKLDYYLATHDVVFSNPAEKGIAYYKLEELMSKLSCRNRMVIMDACHSGEVEKEEASLVVGQKDNPSNVTAKSGLFKITPKIGLNNSFAYMHSLFDDASRATGTHIIGAASGYQVALESGEWNNGAFTYALKSGIALMAADDDKDGAVMVSELQTYLKKTVPALTNGEQTPALRSLNRDNDFRLW